MNHFQILELILTLYSLSLRIHHAYAFTFNLNHKRITKTLPFQRANKQNLIKSVNLKEKSNNDEETTSTSTIDYIDEDAPADVVGAKFFGGNAEKEELYDPIAEENANLEFEESYDTYTYERFSIEMFENDVISAFAKKLQLGFNSICHDNDGGIMDDLYSANFDWESPFKSKGKNPLEELKDAKDFYKRIHVSILSGKELSSSPSTMDIELRWEVSIIWPTVYEPCVLLTGTSKLHLNQSSSDYTITSQTDTPDSKEYLTSIASQLTPRFWDLYHIGMTPSAQLLPKTLLSDSNPFTQPYKVYEIQPTFVLAPTLKDTKNRNDRLGQGVPNHAFSTIIKTMGPTKQRYVPTSPIEIQIDKEIIKWYIYVPTEISSYPMQQCASTTEDETCQYTYQPKRFVATVPYAGNAQDEDVSEIRKKLYKAVMSNSEYKPKLNEDGKPIFFFWMNNCKTCFIRDGLGMAVYDYRPDFAKCNEIGIELEKK